MQNTFDGSLVLLRSFSSSSLRRGVRGGTVASDNIVVAGGEPTSRIANVAAANVRQPVAVPRQLSITYSTAGGSHCRRNLRSRSVVATIKPATATTVVGPRCTGQSDVREMSHRYETQRFWILLNDVDN